ncbi:MAG: TonB-dependent receptor plug domain-containing protein [Gammaproteobacteria bacterium]
MKITRCILGYHLLFLTLFFNNVLAAPGENENVFDLTVEELLNVEVTSVSKKSQSLNDAAAAIYVITQEDIKRTGVTSIPEALRMAPGLDVARIDANKWAVSVRGFNGRFANKLLVLIDGRNTYTRTFAGVYWENQDVMLEDVERIEIIRGPGAALWGANAVNGVINIITKHSSDTLGGLMTAGGGTEEQGFGAFRYGGRLSEKSTGRVYVKGFKRDENTLQSGGEAGDDWDKVQGGFRIDSQLSSQDELTLQGDIYHSNINQLETLPLTRFPFNIIEQNRVISYGGNLLGRLQHTFSPTSEYNLQFYYDYYNRDGTIGEEGRNTLDLDFQHRFMLLDWHEIIWGLGYRYSHDDFEGTEMTALSPESRNDQLANAFIQDEMTLIDNTLWLTLGSKFEHNDYSGFEAQPSAKIMWAPHFQHRLWASVSRSVRTPSRGEHNAMLVQTVLPPKEVLPGVFSPPVAVVLNGSTKFDSEQVISYELGYRTTFIHSLSIDVAAFYNVYHDLRSVRADGISASGAVLEQSVSFRNDNEAHTYGFEVSSVWQMLNWWRWDANYSLLKTDMDDSALRQTGMSPQQRVSVRSVLSLQKDVDLDFWLRYVDTNTAVSTFGLTEIKDYLTLDIRLAWRPYQNIELSLVGQNLLDQHHLEYRQENQTLPTEIDRGMYGKLSWNY